MREIVPHAELVAYIVDLSSVAGSAQLQAMQDAAKAIGQKLLVLNATTAAEIDRAFVTLVEQKADAIIYSSNLFFRSHENSLWP